MNKTDIIRRSGLQKLFKPFYSGIGHILVFHRISPENNSRFHRNLSVTPEYLENVIKYFLSEGIDIVSLDECYNRIRSRGRTKKFVAFTFDDGYADNLSNALPVFEKYNTPLALFLTTGYPDSGIVFWGYMLEEFVFSSEEIIFFYEGEKFYFNSHTFEEKKEVFFKIRKYLRESSKQNILPRLKAVFRDKYDMLFNLTDELMLSWNQIIAMSRHPLVTIGAHTQNHFALSSLTDQEVMNEINGSVKRIEQKTGKTVHYLAYPFGGDREASEREFDLAEKCGLKMAFTANNGNIFKRHAGHLTSLPRIGLNENWSISHLDLYVNGFTPFIDKLRRYGHK